MGLCVCVFGGWVGGGVLEVSARIVPHFRWLKAYASTQHLNPPFPHAGPQVIRNYHGHLSGVYALALHPTLDLVLTGGRDSTCRVWDMRTKVRAYQAQREGCTCSGMPRRVRGWCVHLLLAAGASLGQHIETCTLAQLVP